MTLPNLITLGRLVLVPVILVLIGQGAWGAALAVFVVAGASDALDGFLAKRFGMESALGALLDPLADKALLVSVFVSLATVGALPVWLVAVVIARDLLIVAAVGLAWVSGRRFAIKPLLVGKLNTAAQIGLATLVLVAHAGGWSLDGLVALVCWLVAGTSLLSLAAYARIWRDSAAAPHPRP
ncbi:CDP-alcohol phosphatidyltransferase family protein [Methylobacterium durans]|uniref:CDP-diacylglycerol--glycerol-3-phosphate 3-phosphatidyltransferase n=1 Tax=Methylobacterium durans TaxID=2202825 RepID=A0A2U8W8H6_9HYPH|nr:CDP-alcohol phosphatidyltransferase family protein [Methylobacterium durans]AWN42435.1 CDP-alcohol phosphatidyltransferase [Methylobacterium durans]